MPRTDGGYWDMHCFNGLSAAQRKRVVEHGNLPFGYRAEGSCERPAELEVETKYDSYPGPRFYCVSCAIEYLKGLNQGVK
jgi:hypothetical protein